MSLYTQRCLSLEYKAFRLLRGFFNPNIGTSQLFVQVFKSWQRTSSSWRKHTVYRMTPCEITKRHSECDVRSLRSWITKQTNANFGWRNNAPIVQVLLQRWRKCKRKKGFSKYKCRNRNIHTEKTWTFVFVRQKCFSGVVNVPFEMKQVRTFQVFREIIQNIWQNWITGPRKTRRL